MFEAGNHVLGETPLLGESHHLFGEPGRRNSRPVGPERQGHDVDEIPGVPFLPFGGLPDEIVVRMVPLTEPEHRVDVHHERLSLADPPTRGRRAGPAGQPRAVTAGDLVSAREGPFPFAARLAHGVGRDPRDLRFRLALIPAVHKRSADGPVPHIDDPGGLAEPVDRPFVLDQRQPVDDVIGVHEPASGQGGFELLILEMGEHPLRQVVGEAVFHADPAPLDAQLLPDEIGDQADLIHAAHRGVSEDVILVQPGVVGDPCRVDHEGEDRRQPLFRDDDIGPPGAECIGQPGGGAQTRTQVDIDPGGGHRLLNLCHPCGIINEVRIMPFRAFFPNHDEPPIQNSWEPLQ